MKYNTLLVGSQEHIKDEFFFNMCERFDCACSSSRADDLKKHIRAFRPQLLVLCVKEDAAELAFLVQDLRRDITEADIVCAVIGEKADVTNYCSHSREPAHIILERPLTNSAIIEKIDAFFKERDEERAELERQKKEAAKTRRHILVVDDDPNMLKTIKAQLEDEYNVATAVNGGLALRFLTNKTTDLILLDYEMPGQSGDTVLTILRNSEQTRDIPVIFLTGVADPDKVAKVLALNPQGYMLKPIDNVKLHKTVTAVLEERYGQA